VGYKILIKVDQNCGLRTGEKGNKCIKSQTRLKQTTGPIEFVVTEFDCILRLKRRNLRKGGCCFKF